MLVLRRLTSIVEAIAESSSAPSLSDLVAQTGLPRSSIHRTVQALEREGYVTRTPECSGYQLGPGLLKYGIGASLELIGANRAQLLTLSRSINENVELAILCEGKALIIDEVAAPQRLPGIPRIGRSEPLHATGIGKALISRFSDAQIDHLLHAPLKRFTPNTQTDPSALRGELSTARRNNLAADMEERREGFCSIATATTTPFGRMQAVGLVIPANRIRQKIDSAVEGLARINPGIDVAAAKVHFLAR